MRQPFPFSAIVGQDEMKRAMILIAIDPGLGGVLLTGDRGTGKTTALQGLAALLPQIAAVPDCPLHSATPAEVPDWAELDPRPPELTPTPVVHLPPQVSQAGLTGTLDLDRTLTGGERAFLPGLLAQANRGYLCIDGIGRLDSRITDLLLAVDDRGANVVTHGVSMVGHSARFAMVATCAPDDGVLRPDLRDRFGLSVMLAGPRDTDSRIEVIRRRQAHDADEAGFLPRWQAEDAALRERIDAARRALPELSAPERILRDCAELCLALGTIGLRGELALLRAARAYAAWHNDTAIARRHLRDVAAMALGHRLHRDAARDAEAGAHLARLVTEFLD